MFLTEHIGMDYTEVKKNISGQVNVFEDALIWATVLWCYIYHTARGLFQYKDILSVQGFHI